MYSIRFINHWFVLCKSYSIIKKNDRKSRDSVRSDVFYDTMDGVYRYIFHDSIFYIFTMKLLCKLFGHKNSFTEITFDEDVQIIDGEEVFSPKEVRYHYQCFRCNQKTVEIPES